MENILGDMEDEFDYGMVGLPDPYLCTVDISTTCSVADTARRALLPLLEGIDPTFQFIAIKGYAETPSLSVDSFAVSSPTLIPEERDRPDIESRQNMDNRKLVGTRKTFETPALAVMLFLRDCGPLSYETFRRYFLQKPWKFHHKIEISSARKGTVRSVGKQEFYQIDGASDLPLWSVCPVHIGNEHIRFTVFTKNFAAMLDFYRLLCASEVENSKPGFCLFELYSQPGFGVQLALKYSAQLEPRPLKYSVLKMRIKSVNTVWSCLRNNPLQCGLREYLIQDPDGNNIVVEETGDMDQYSYSWKDLLELPVCDSPSDDVSDSLDSGRCSSFSDSGNNEADVSRCLPLCTCKDDRQIHDTFSNNKTVSEFSCPKPRAKSAHFAQFESSNRVSNEKNRRASTRSSNSDQMKTLTPVRF